MSQFVGVLQVLEFLYATFTVQELERVDVDKHSPEDELWVRVVARAKPRPQTLARSPQFFSGEPRVGSFPDLENELRTSYIAVWERRNMAMGRRTTGSGKVRSSS